MNNDIYNNISTSGRIFRIVLSVGLVMFVMNSAAPLGNLAYLPFVSIYAGITGFIGADPVNALASMISKKMAAKPSYARHGGMVTQ